MKKYILLLSSALFLLGAASCTKFESEKSLPVVDATTPTLTLVSAGETELSVTVAAAEGTGFYSYTVLPGAAKDLNPSSLFAVKCKGLVEATVNYADEQSVTVTATGLARNAKYTVYAVAASEQGTVGKVASLEILTSDTEAPSIAGASADENVVTLTFSEPVTMVEGKTVVADYYAQYSGYANATPDGQAEVTVEVEGDEATITVDGLYPGAYYAVSFPEGTFVDALNNPLPALESGLYIDEDGEVAEKGVVAQLSHEPFDLGYDTEDGEPITILATMATYIWLSLPETTILADYDDTVNGTIVYNGEGETHTYVTNYGYDFGVTEEGRPYVIPNYAEATGRPDAARGQIVDIVVPEGVFIDAYGNTNNEFALEPFLFSYGYQLEQFFGTYSFVGVTNNAGEQAATTVVIAPDDEVENGVIIYDLLNVTEDLMAPLPWTPQPYNVTSGIVDVHGGLISIEDPFFLGYATYQGQAIKTFGYNFGDPMLLQMPQPGTMKLASTIYVYLNGLGYWDVYIDGTLTKTSDSYEYTLPETTASLQSYHNTEFISVNKMIER